jgi:cell division protein FtsW
LASLGLTFYGFVVLFSATQAIDHHALLFVKQWVWFGVAMLGFVCSIWIRLEKIKPYIGIVTAVTLLLLVAVIAVGLRVNGTRRWFQLGPVRVQASEPAKIGYILTLAYWLSAGTSTCRSFRRGFVLPCGIVGLFCVLVLAEPDFGTAFLFGVVGLFLLYLNGARLSFLIPTILVGISLFLTATYFDPIRWRRITAFLDLEGNRLTGAYQLWQSLVGFCTGGLTGVGLGQGRQQHFFLPEAHTDFIFAILAEEMGLVNVLIVLFLFGVIAYNGLRIIRNTGSPFLFFVSSGALCFLIFQAFLNVGVVTGMLPTKGLALPFVSYGGSNLVANYVLVGLLINVAVANSRPITCLVRREL